MDGINLEVIN